LTYSGWFTHKCSGHPSATGRAQDKESLPAKDRRSTAVPLNPQNKSFENGVYVLVIPVQYGIDFTQF